MWITNTVKNRLISVSTIGTATSTTALNANSDRIGFVIQNVGTNVIYVALNSTVTTSAYDYLLQGGSAGADGKGGVLSLTNQLSYTGIVTVQGAALSFTAWEI